MVVMANRIALLALAADRISLGHRTSILAALHIAAAQIGASADEVAAALRLVARPADTTGSDAWNALAATWRAGKAA
jgi:hypothetical protein